MRGGCLITIPKAYRLVRIKEKGAALAHQGGGHPLSDHGDSTKYKAAQEVRISHGRQVYLLSVCQ